MTIQPSIGAPISDDKFAFDNKVLTEAELLEVEEPRLRHEQAQIMREQSSGLWNEWEAKGEGHKVEARVRTGIAIAAILRRQNTGPAKPASKRKLKETVNLEDLLG